MTLANMPALVAGLLALAALLACARLLRQRHGQRLRLALLLAVQPLLAGLLYFTLFPPTRPVANATLTVLTADAPRMLALPPGPLVALPEAGDRTHADAVPDLATALRRHPETRRLHIIGAGLEPRDLEAARGWPLAFEPSVAPSGIVALHGPDRVVLGNSFMLHGRIAGRAGDAVELLDPAGQRVQRVVADKDGRFALQGTALAEGAMTFALRLLGKAGDLRETLPVPLHAIAPAPPRLLLLAGAPNPELKYLRRWAADAGLGLHTRISAGGGLVLGDTPLSLDAATLRRFDIVQLDQRSLQALSVGEFRALTAAANDGLGVLVRVAASLSASERARLREWGFATSGDGRPAPIRLADAGDPLPALLRPALQVTSADAIPLQRDAAQQPLGWWRTAGRGRIALVALDESYTLVLAGQARRHAALWSDIIATIARSANALPALPPTAPAWVGERIVLCGLQEGAVVIAPDGKPQSLSLAPASGNRRCAAFWPEQAGWHRLRQGDTQTPFAVLSPGDGKGLRAQRRRDATTALAAQTPAATMHTERPIGQRGPSWPWLLAWLALAALAWTLERWRRGDAPARSG